METAQLAEELRWAGHDEYRSAGIRLALSLSDFNYFRDSFYASSDLSHTIERARIP